MLGEIITKIGLALLLAGFSLAVLGVVCVFVGFAIGETF